MTCSVEIIEGFLGVPLERADRAIDSLAEPRLRELAERLRLHYSALTLPKKGDGEIRAFVDAWGSDISVALGTSLFTNGQPSFQENLHIDMALANVRNFLLYYHTLALDDPVSFMVEHIHPDGEYYKRLSRRPADEFLNLRKRLLKSAVRILAEIKPFVRKRLVHLYDGSAALSFLPQMDTLREFVHGRQEYRELAERYQTQWLVDTSNLWVLQHARMMLATTLQSDFVSSSLWGWDALDLDLRILGHTIRSSGGGGDLLRSDVLSLVHLPGLEGMSTREFVKIRENEEAFERWRSDLSHVIMHLDTRNAHSASLGQDFLQIARTLLTPRIQEINRSLSKSRKLRRHLRAAAYGFCSSAATAVAGALDLQSCLQVASAGGSAAVLFSLLFGNPPRKQEGVSKLYTAIVDSSAHDRGVTRVV